MLEIKNLNKYFGQKQVLHQVSFSITQGHITGLIGANGAGKTTIMKSILGITNFSGEIRFKQSLITVNQHLPLQNVGALIEYPGLYPFLTGREQLQLFATGKKQQKVESIIQKLNISSFADIKTKDYSLGMKQKLGVALALVNQPPMVILDEPMNGLDPQATKELRDLIIAEKNHGVSFLISSHILSELQKLADDVVIIDHGQIIKNTTMSQLLAANQHYILLKTDNDQLALQLLDTVGYQISQTKESLQVLKTSQFKIGKLLRILFEHNLEIIDIQQQEGDLEESLLKVLNGNDKTHIRK
ncbi:ABC transporter ATP-binding protein [Bombilactobacillus bombi]|uniref:ABC transporter ATP-binding protein n=1 Tax=Bombilactobacillus bombi TaxID=1303590 RepID=UPI0015E5A653|nr:ATP-binding cassette domain-containing protein [Bombilactobacillus bombi]MBA1435284.1 ATP-binding cassette domain-containing protein [Bombilactobacillus bombi]